MNEVQQAIENALKVLIEDAVREVLKENVNEVLWETVPKILEAYTKSLTDPLPRLYTKEEVCEKLSICPATYHNWIRSGKITEMKVRGRVYVDARALDEALECGTIIKGGRRSTKLETSDMN